MARTLHFKYFLLILCLGAANLPAQEPEMIAPPIPSSYPAPPPDPDTLPAPPQPQWDPLGPSSPGDVVGPLDGVIVPLPLPEAAIAPPPPPVVETPTTTTFNPAEVEIARPDVEVWRPDGDEPQTPPRYFNRLAHAFVTGTEPAVLRVQFSPLAAGKQVYVKPERGVTLNPPVVVMTVSSSGECIVSAQLAEGVMQAHIVFYCEGIKTVLPVVRAPLPMVQEMEGQ
jgi:hypothetical protein